MWVTLRSLNNLAFRRNDTGPNLALTSPMFHILLALADGEIAVAKTEGPERGGTDP